jgi:uncharacterized protein
VLLHGLSGSRGDMTRIMQGLADADYSVLAVSLRAHGDSMGDRCDFGWSSHTARREFDYLA